MKAFAGLDDTKAGELLQGFGTGASQRDAHRAAASATGAGQGRRRSYAWPRPFLSCAARAWPWCGGRLGPPGPTLGPATAVAEAGATPLRTSKDRRCLPGAACP